MYATSPLDNPRLIKSYIQGFIEYQMRQKELKPEYYFRTPFNLMQLFCYVTNVVGV